MKPRTGREVILSLDGRELALEKYERCRERRPRHAAVQRPASGNFRARSSRRPTHIGVVEDARSSGRGGKEHLDQIDPRARAIAELALQDAPGPPAPPHPIPT